MTYRCDNCDPLANQIDSKSRQSIEFVLGGTVQDRHVLAFDKTGLLEALLESAQLVLVPRLGEESNHRQRRLLRSRSDWPSHRSSAHECDELAPLHGSLPRALRYHTRDKS